MTTHTTRTGLSTRPRLTLLVPGLVLAATVISGCSSGGGSGSSGASPTTAASSAATSPVLPVTSNPIKATSTVEALSIDSVLVENNVTASGATADDHLEIALTNGGAKELTAFEVYYTFSDSKTGDTESYYLALPDSFTIAPGAQRVAHFDNTGATDHFAVSDFSLYATDTNALDVTVEVSAQGTAPQTASVTKDAGGAEQAD